MMDQDTSRDQNKAYIVGPNDPVRLTVAAQLFFPDGSMTESDCGLRRDAAD